MQQTQRQKRASSSGRYGRWVLVLVMLACIGYVRMLRFHLDKSTTEVVNDAVAAQSAHAAQRASPSDAAASARK